MADKTLQTHRFNCSNCGLKCVAEKIQEGADGLRIDIEHYKPECSMFRAMNTAEFLNAELTVARAKQAAT